MKLRKAILDDWEILLDWRNDPITRLNSFDQKEIQELNHKTWLMDSLMNEYREIYVLEENFIPVGSIRVDRINLDKYMLSWTISPDHRGKGYGNKILEILLQDRKGEFMAEIKSENVASIKMTENNGFKLLSQDNNKLTYTKTQL